jgi:hypothetical protein
MEDIQEKLYEAIEIANKTHDINDIIGEQEFHGRVSSDTREAISNAYNKVEDAVKEIRAACEDGLRASRSAVASLR